MPVDFEKALLNPALSFPEPDRVLIEPTLSVSQKEAILESWERDAIRLQESEAEGFSGGERSRLDRVRAALAHLRKRG